MRKPTILRLALAAVLSLPLLAQADPTILDSDTYTGATGLAGGIGSDGISGTSPGQSGTQGGNGGDGGDGGNGYAFNNGVLIISGGTFTGGSGGQGGRGGFGGNGADGASGGVGGNAGRGGNGGVGGNGANGLYLAPGTTVTISGGTFAGGNGGDGGDGGDGGGGGKGGPGVNGVNGGKGGKGGNGGDGGDGVNAGFGGNVGLGGPGALGKSRGSDGLPGLMGAGLGGEEPGPDISGSEGWGIYDDGATIEFQGYSFSTNTDLLSRADSYLATIQFTEGIDTQFTLYTKNLGGIKFTSLASIPEPSTAAGLCGIAALAFVVIRRRRSA